jgi:hypothetical protein
MGVCSVLKPLFDPRAPSSERRRALSWVYLGSAAMPGLTALLVYRLSGSVPGIAAWVGGLFSGLWAGALVWLELAKWRVLQGKQPVHMVRAALMDAALLGLAWVLAAWLGRAGLPQWATLLFLLGGGHYLWGFLRLRSRL